jgi:uncharacterized protein YggE
MKHRSPLLPIVLVLSFLAAAASAQKATDFPSISTSGSAEVRVVPDRIEISLGVETFNTQLRPAKEENDRQVAKVIAVAKKHGIDPKQIQTDYLSIEPNLSRADQPPGSYTVRRAIVIQSGDIAGFEDLLSAVIAAGANHVQNIRFMTSQLRVHRDEARKMAAKAALEKAQLLAESLGRKVGKVRNISEASDSWWSSYNWWWGRWGSQYQNVSQNVASANQPESEGPLAPGRISVSASVQVTFELE